MRQRAFTPLKILSLTGFTLLEMLIVVIILGILAGIALPRYIRSLEKSRDSEAYVHLGLIRTAEIEYYADFNTFTNNLDTLSIDNPNLLPPPPIGTRLFTYSVTPAPPTNNFTATATRVAGTSTHMITIDQNGRTARTVTP